MSNITPFTTVCQAPRGLFLEAPGKRKAAQRLGNRGSCLVGNIWRSVVKKEAPFRGSEWFTTLVPLSFAGEGDTGGEVNKQPLPLVKGKGGNGQCLLSPSPFEEEGNNSGALPLLKDKKGGSGDLNPRPQKSSLFTFS